MCRLTDLCCFRCLAWFEKIKAEEYQVCGDWKCPCCHSCLCALSTGEKRVAVAYMLGYEKALAKVTGVEYDMKKHAKIMNEVGAPS